MAHAITADRRTEVEHNPAKFNSKRDDPQKGEQSRSERARHEEMRVEARVENGKATGVYDVYSESGKKYTVDLNADEVHDKCSCVDSSVNKAQCKHQRRVALEIQMGGLAAPGEDVFEFAVNDVVLVDWSEGMGPESEFIGVVTDIAESNGETIVGVTDYNNEEFTLGKTYDCAPEWVTPVDDLDDSDDEEPETLPDEQTCIMCDQPAVDMAGQLCEDHLPE